MQYVGLARPADLGALLRIGPEPLSVSWSNPSRSLHVTGLGVAGEGGGDVTWLSTLPPRPPPGPWFGGWAFDAKRPWKGFDSERWILPEVLAWWDGRQPWIAAFGPAGTDAAALEKRLARVEEVEPFTGTIHSKATPGSRTKWDRLISGAVKAIDAGTFDKVVCARVIDLECERELPERSILKALEARHKQCWSFLLRGKDGRAFVGASPETLCESCDDVFCTDALAGTAAGGQGGSLLRSDKDRREHAAVVEGIRESLAPFTLNVTHPPTPSVKVLANVDHLFTPIRGQVKPGVQHLDVARALHPTPAVAGRPREAALAWLAEHEGFSRGWYTGAVGTMGPAGVTLAVALRSALLDGTRAQVFVGAGIVAGSTAESEWIETERKSRAMLPALGVHAE
jgi:salicylate biosynthesis isochorismate synthase/menaquinone-specific isochorismate synthase